MPEIQRHQSLRFTRRPSFHGLILAIAWTSVIVLSFWLNAEEAKVAILDLARAEARGSYNKDVVYRRWAAQHGGVYVPVTKETPPNPFLSFIEERDIVTPLYRRLTLVNPAYMTRQVHELGKDQYGAKAHLTSTRPLNPGNEPDHWERKALLDFERGASEISSLETINGELHLRFMRPMFTEQGCLKCHSHQGYQLGDIRGGLSVSIPLEPYLKIEGEQILTLGIWHGVIWVLGLVWIGFGVLFVSHGLKREEHTQKALHKWAHVFQHAEWGIVTGSVDGRILDLMNPAFARMHGFSIEELIGRPIFEVYAPECRAELPKHIEIANREGHHTFESIHVRKDGSIFPVLMDVTAIKDEQGRVLYRVVHIQDITQRKKVEEELEEERQLVNAVLKNLRVGIVSCNTEGMVTYFNQAAREFHGLPQGSLPLEQWEEYFDLYFPNGTTLIGKEEIPLSRALRGEEFDDLEMIIAPKEGGNHSVLAGGQPLLGADGKSLGAVVTLYDITERKRSEQDLSDSKASLAKAQQIAHLGNWDWNIQENTLFWSDEIYRIFGLSPKKFEATYEDFLNSIHPEDRELVQNAVARALYEDQPYEINHRIILPDGTERWVIEQGEVNFDKEGEPIRMLGTILDVTERTLAEMEKEELEMKFRQSQKLEAIGTLAGGIAHDFNNILTPILGYTELLQIGMEPMEKEYKYLTVIQRATLRAKDLVGQIQIFSRQTEHEKKPIRIKSIVNETLKFLQASLPPTIEIRRNFTSDATIMADPTQVHQVIMNLCTNAGFAMGKRSGILDVALGDMLVSPEFAETHPGLSQGHYLLLTVRDNGAGMTPEVKERIFDPFFTTRENVGGSGMGLSVVHGIIKSYEGAITVESELGEGSTFNVYFPIIPEDSVADAEEEEQQSFLTGREHILFVDDEEFVLEMAEHMLEGLGYTVTTRRNAPEALESFRDTPEAFDLVITDMTMPLMRGDDFSRQVIDVRPDIPIILCTGSSERISEEKMTEMGVRGVVMKPFYMKELAKTIRNILDGG